jgi:hypothetical protein
MRKITNRRRKIVGSMKKKNSKKSHKYHVKKNKKSRKNNFIGGQRYGTGVGSNCYDPNLSIFNTNLLKLFPYKPI